MNREEFNKLASEEFDVTVGLLDLRDANEFLALASKHYEDWGFVAVGQDVSPAAFAPLTREEVEEYGEYVWCTKCPVCETDLQDRFVWGLIHGQGYCSECGKTSFRLFHRPRKGMYPIMKYALIGF